MIIYFDLDYAHVVSESEANKFINVELRDVTNIEFERLLEAKRISEMSQEQKITAIDRACDMHYDYVAALRGWGRVGITPSAACYARAGYPNHWQPEAIKFVQWVDSCVAYLIAEKAKVIAGTRTMPTPEQAVAELPPMVW